MSEAELEQKRQALLNPGQSVDDLLAAELRVSYPTLAALRTPRPIAASKSSVNPLANAFTGFSRPTPAAPVAEFDDDTLDTTAVLFKRYCSVRNITAAASPHTVFYTCLFVALKIEEQRLTVEELVAKLSALRDRRVPVPAAVAADIILGEPKLLAALRFHLHVFHPLTALRGHLSCVFPSASAPPPPTPALILKEESAFDHVLVLAPSLRAVAALVRFHNFTTDDENPTFDAVHRYLKSPRFLDACGFSSLSDPKFAALVSLSARLHARAQRAAPELF
jgi:hypothetical protein